MLVFFIILADLRADLIAAALISSITIYYCLISKNITAALVKGIEEVAVAVAAVAEAEVEAEAAPSYAGP